MKFSKLVLKWFKANTKSLMFFTFLVQGKIHINNKKLATKTQPLLIYYSISIYDYYAPKDICNKNTMKCSKGYFNLYFFYITSSGYFPILCKSNHICNSLYIFLPRTHNYLFINCLIFQERNML